MEHCEHTGMVSAYHDRELPDAAHTQLERHLAQCPECRAELGRLTSLARLLARVPADPIPPAALARLHGAVDALPALGIRRMAWTLAAAAAAILIVCMIGITTPSFSASSATIPVWETQAVAQQPRESTGSEESLAAWMIQDLSWKNEHD